MCPSPVPTPTDQSQPYEDDLRLARQLQLDEGDILIKLGTVDVLVVPLPPSASREIQGRVADLGGTLYPHSPTPGAPALALAVFTLKEGDGLRRIMRDTYCNSKWTPFGQLGVVVPPGGSMGMDDKLLVFPLSLCNGTHSGTGGVVRFEHGIPVREFRDLRANPRCALEYTFMGIRRLLESLNSSFAPAGDETSGSGLGRGGLERRVILTGRPGESMAVPSIIADVLGLPVFSPSTERGIIAAHRPDYLAAHPDQHQEELDLPTPTAQTVALDPEDEVYLLPHTREHSGSTVTTATESTGPATPPSLPALRNVAIASRPLTPLDPSRLTLSTSSQPAGKSPPAASTAVLTRKPTRPAPTPLVNSVSVGVKSPRATSHSVRGEVGHPSHARARSLSHSHSRTGSIGRSLPPLREEEERAPTPTQTANLESDAPAGRQPSEVTNTSHAHGSVGSGSGEMILLARPSTAHLIYTAMMPEFLRLQNLVVRRLVPLSGPWVNIDHARKPMYEHGSHSHSTYAHHGQGQGSRPTTVTHMSMLYPPPQPYPPPHTHPHSHSGILPHPHAHAHDHGHPFGAPGEAGQSLAMSMGLGTGMGLGMGMGIGMGMGSGEA